MLWWLLKSSFVLSICFQSCDHGGSRGFHPPHLTLDRFRHRNLFVPQIYICRYAVKLKLSVALLELAVKCDGVKSSVLCSSLTCTCFNVDYLCIGLTGTHIYSMLHTVKQNGSLTRILMSNYFLFCFNVAMCFLIKIWPRKKDLTCLSDFYLYVFWTHVTQMVIFFCLFLFS